MKNIKTVANCKQIRVKTILNQYFIHLMESLDQFIVMTHNHEIPYIPLH